MSGQTHLNLTNLNTKVSNASRAIHIVSAWSKANQLSLGQVKVDEKSNEITAIPKLLDVLVVKGCLVTIDAMGCQREIAARIIEKVADYLLAVKGNQRCLEENAEAVSARTGVLKIICIGN
ncbi:hypothetical protein AGMMS50239_29870 [Bacteroidia bacterium]|nr:hypothetical protein AGMMS50239_29870 [Bacteroidia bacterium]